MDKYAVDLDQVLNDFEYSELTDQYNNASRSAAAATSSLNQNSITKHSINNVFHSLNEYLNTNINVDSVNQIDNNLLENNEKCVNTVNISQNKYKDEEKSIKDNSKTDTLLLDLNGEINENGIVNEIEVKCSEGKLLDFYEKTNENGVSESEVRSDEVIEFKDEKTVINEEICTEDVIIENANAVENEGKIEDEKIEVYINGKQEEENSNAVEDTHKFSENEVCAVPNNAEICENSINERVENPVEKVGFNDDLELDDSEVMKMLEELEKEEEGSNDELKSHITEDLSESVCEKVTEIEDEQLEEAASVELTNQSNDKEADDVIEGNVASDTEILVETESKENLAISIPEKNCPSEDIKEITVDEAVPRDIMDVEEKTKLAVNDDKTTIREKATEELEELNVKEAEYPEIEKEDSVESISSPENLPLNKEERSKETEHREIEKEDSVESISRPQNLPLNGEERTKETEHPEIEKEDSVESISRPQNLPLNGEGDQPKRQINLIGDPGSTPYNNVYINKEIPKSKEKPYDSDTDYSTSSSPTFSDASSTTSTVSADEVHNNVEKASHTVPKDVAVPSSTGNTDPTVFADQASKATNPAPEAINPASEVSPAPDSKNPACDNGVFEPVSQAATSEVPCPAQSGSEAELGAGRPHVENLDVVAVGTINLEKQWLGKEAPLWVPDSDALSCLHCDMKFTVLKRRHHCRACGLVLCSKCCHLRFRLEYLDAEARVCNKCHNILNKDTNSTSSSEMSPEVGNSPSHRPNPNNPLEYCSTVSPLEQTAGANPNPPAVMVPVGVLKRKGSNKAKSNKSVMFCDGIRPGSDLTNLDNDFDYNNTKTKRQDKVVAIPTKPKKNLPTLDPETNTFIPSSENCLPPTVTWTKTEISYTDCQNGPTVVEVLKNEQLTFAVHVNLYVHVKIIGMSCCVNKTAWCFSTEGLINVGQDEIVILLEYIDEESFVPKDVFYHINTVYNDAAKGTSVKELGLSLHNTSNFLDSKNHAGFVYIRPTFQCLENVIKPKEPYLVGILIHRWETPWAKLFPLRLVLRLGAEYRYYPSPIISTRHRESVFVEIGHTIINLLADFRNFSYTLPQIRGLTIHMEDKNTTITIPSNQYDQVMKSMSNSSDHILAFAGVFSQQADSHLVCIQDTQSNENCYSTHAINIHNKPRKITGASFIVFNGALKSTSGLTAKSNIVEDGLMIQVLPEHMQLIRDNLRAMKNHTIPCGCVNAASDETVNIIWGENDSNFNMGVVSTIDDLSLSGVASIRVHNAKNHVNGGRFIRWTEVFIIQNSEDNAKNQDSINISRVGESIAKAACDALVKYLDLLVANGCQKIGIRATLNVDNVSYLAGSNGAKLAPIYMKSLDDELIPVLHRLTTNSLGEHSVVLELIFRILNM